MSETRREKELKKKITELQDQLVEHRENKSIKCPCCEKRTKIKKATIITCFHYIKPRGCMDGDYWAFSHEYMFYCAKCDSFNRAYIGSFDQIKYGKDYSESNMHPKVLEKERVKMYFLIDRNSHLFGEQLSNYDYNGTIEDIRRENKRHKDNLAGCYY